MEISGYKCWMCDRFATVDIKGVYSCGEHTLNLALLIAFSGVAMILKEALQKEADILGLTEQNERK